MSIKESMLNIVSDLAQNDYIRAVTYGGYSRRVEVSELAKSVVEDYTGSSLAGENQSVQGAFSALETEIQNVEQDVTTEINDAILNILPTATASGEIASFPDGSDLSPALSVVAGIEPVQDLHGYGSPWLGGAGKNKIPYPYYETTKTAYGITWTDMGDGQIMLNGTASARTVFFLRYHSEENSIPSGSYILSKGFTSQTVGISIDAYNGNTWVRNIGQTVASDNVPITIDYNGYDKLEIFITVANGAVVNNQVVKPMLRLATVSDTTWTPYENICPISGHDDLVIQQTGVNVWDEEWQNGYLGNSGSVISDANSVCSKNYIPIKQSATYYAVCPNGKSLRICAYKADKTFISLQSVANQTFTLPSGTAYIKWSCYGYGATYNNDISINYPSTDHDYHAYNGNAYTIDLGQTVYGATLTYTYADGVASWAMTVDRATDDMGTFNWGAASNGGTAVAAWTNSSNLVSDAKRPPNNNTVANIISSHYEPKTANEVYLGADGGIAIGATDGKVSVYDTSLTGYTAAQVKTAMSGRTICYELATPTTIQLTETQVVELFKGYNNVFSDAGDMSVTYKADVQLYIDKQTNELRVAILALS